MGEKISKKVYNDAKKNYYAAQAARSDARKRAKELEDSINREQTWLSKNARHLSNDCNIIFQGKTFVFTGMRYMDEYQEILGIVKKLGGVTRTTVSGVTDYLIVNPSECGLVKFRTALEQRAKGNYVAVVTMSDFLKAIDFDIPSLNEQLAQQTKIAKDSWEIMKAHKAIIDQY